MDSTELVPSCLQFLNLYISPIIVIFGLIGNVLSIIVLRSRRMRSPVSIYLLSLAVCDSLLLFSAVGLFLETALNQPPVCLSNETTSCPIAVTTMATFHNVTHTPSSIYALAVSHFFYPLGLTAQMATIWITVCLTAERFVAGCYPLHANFLSSIPRARTAILSCVICAVVYNIPRWFEMSYFTSGAARASELDDGNCTEQATLQCLWHSMFRVVYYTWGYILFMFLLPVLALTVMNVRLIQALRLSDVFRNESRSVCLCSTGSYATSYDVGSTWPTVTSRPKSTRRGRLCSCYKSSSNRVESDRVYGGANSPHCWRTPRVSVTCDSLHSGRIVNATSPPVMRTDKNVTRLVIVVVGVFIACQLPAMVYNIYFGIVSPSQPAVGWCALSEIRNFLVVVNSSINFVVYCCMGAKFRRSFIHVITPCYETQRVIERNDTRSQALRAVDVNSDVGQQNWNLLVPVGVPGRSGQTV